MNKRILQFSILALLLVVACVIPLKVADAASGSISANSQFVYISSGLGSTTLTYSTSGCTTAQVYVNINNTNDRLMTQGASGTCNIGWIQPGYAYAFKVYANTTRTELLASVTVVGYGTNSGNIGAYETEAVAPGTTGNASMKLVWGANGYTTSQVYVSVNGGTDVLMSQGTTGNATPSWLVPGSKYAFKLYANTTHTTLLDTVTVYGRRFAYGAGSNYHATGSNFDTTSFLRDYHVTAVRNTVKSQLQGMANAGATHIRHGLYITVTSGSPTEKWKLHFPPTAQELTNLRTFAQDVAAIQATDGHRLLLDLEFYWMWASSYQVGTPTTTLGNENLSPTTYKSYITTTYEDVVDKVYNIYRPDSKKVINTICFDNETMSVKTNTLWFFGNAADGYSGLYEDFVSYCQSHSVTPGLEIHPDLSNAAYVMSTTLPDYVYSLLDGHRSMYWAYRTLKLFNDNDIHIPEMIDFSMYPAKGSYTYSQLIKKIFDDADAVLPSLGTRKYYRLTEMYYLTVSSEREELGAAICEERLRDNRVTGVEFWNTPYNGGWPDPTGYPFDFADYLP